VCACVFQIISRHGEFPARSRYHFSSPTAIEHRREWKSRSVDRQHNVITVGGCAAGCLLAVRLSEVPGWAVMLLEAGGKENFLQDIPSIATKLQSTATDRVYRTEKSKSFFLGMTSDHCHWPRVKVLGGNTVINCVGYCSGNRADCDDWGALRNKGWDYAHTLSFYLMYKI
jgi:choline dehydrogenase-like flavoprotein